MENETVQIQSVFSIKAWDASTSDVVVKMLVANHVPSMLNEQLFLHRKSTFFDKKKGTVIHLQEILFPCY